MAVVVVIVVVVVVVVVAAAAAAAAVVAVAAAGLRPFIVAVGVGTASSVFATCRRCHVAGVHRGVSHFFTAAATVSWWCFFFAFDVNAIARRPHLNRTPTWSCHDEWMDSLRALPQVLAAEYLATGEAVYVMQNILKCITKVGGRREGERERETGNEREKARDRDRDRESMERQTHSERERQSERARRRRLVIALHSL
jgi:hypothetical protein